MFLNLPSSIDKKLNKFIKLTKNYDEDSHKGYILEIDLNYQKNYMICIVIHDFCLRQWKLINAKNMYAHYMVKKTMLTHKDLNNGLKQSLNNGLVLKKVHRVIQFNQESWLKTYFGMNIEIRKKQKMILKNTFLS